MLFGLRHIYIANNWGFFVFPMFVLLSVVIRHIPDKNRSQLLPHVVKLNLVKDFIAVCFNDFYIKLKKKSLSSVSFLLLFFSPCNSISLINSQLLLLIQKFFCARLVVVTDCFDQLALKKYSRFLYCSICEFLLSCLCSPFMRKTP